MATDRTAAASTTAVGTTGVIGGALLRAGGTERARKLNGTRHHLAINDVRRVGRLPHGRRAIAMYAGGNLLGAAAAPAALIGGSTLVRRQTVRKDFVASGITGAVDALHQKATNGVQKKPAKARAAGLGTGAATAGLGTLAAHKLMDGQDRRRVARGLAHIPFRRRTALAAVGGLLGSAAGIPAGAAVTRRVAPGYTVTAAGVTKEPVRKFADASLMPRCPVCGTRALGACPTCHEIPPAVVSKRATVHLGTGRSRSAACNAANATRTTRSTSAVTCEACKRTHGYRSRTAVSKRTPLQDAGRWSAGIAGVTAAGAGGEHLRGQNRREITAEAAGGLAAQGAYQGAGYRAKHAAQAKHDGAVTRAQRDKRLKPVKREHGAYTAGMERHYPRSLPEWKTHRVLGYTHRGRLGTSIGAGVTVAGALGAGHFARRPVRKNDDRAARAHIYAAGSVPIVGMASAARQAGREAPASQRRQAAAIQYGGTLGAGVAGAYGLSAVHRVPAAGRQIDRANAAKDRATAAVKHRIVGDRTSNPASALARGAARVHGAKVAVKTGASARLAQHPGALRVVTRAAAPLKRAGAPVALAGYTAGKFAGGQGAISFNQARAHRVSKVAPVLSRGEEQRQIRRQRHNAALGTLNAGIGTAGVGIYGASLHPKVPKHVKGRLATAAIGTTIAGGGLGAVAGFRGAAAQRHDARVREARIEHHRDLLHPFGKVAVSPDDFPYVGVVRAQVPNGKTMWRQAAEAKRGRYARQSWAGEVRGGRTRRTAGRWDQVAKALAGPRPIRVPRVSYTAMRRTARGPRTYTVRGSVA